MTKIKVTVKSIEQAIVVIEFWKDKDVELTISIVDKENITTENSDVNKIINTHNKMFHDALDGISRNNFKQVSLLNRKLFIDGAEIPLDCVELVNISLNFEKINIKFVGTDPLLNEFTYEINNFAQPV